MFGFVQATSLKRLATKTTNAIIMSGLALGVGSAIFLSLLKHLFGKSSKLEAISAQQETEEEAGKKEESSPLVLFITPKKPKPQALTETSSNSFVSTSPSSATFSPSSSSSSNQVAVEAQISEIELKPLPEMMLLDEECLKNKLKDDYIVLVIPRKPKTESQSVDKNETQSEDQGHAKLLRSQRNSVDCSDTLSKLLGQSFQRCSFPQMPALEEWKMSEGNRACRGEETNEDEENTGAGSHLSPGISAAMEQEGALAQCSSWLAGHETSVTGSEGAYVFTSSDMRSIFENELSMSESLANCGSDVMQKLADIEEKLCLVHVDTDDMMSYINAVKRSEKLAAGGSFLRRFETSTPTSTKDHEGVLMEGPVIVPDLDYLLDFSLQDDLGGSTESRDFEEWSFEDQLGNPNDDSF